MIDEEDKPVKALNPGKVFALERADLAAGLRNHLLEARTANSALQQSVSLLKEKLAEAHAKLDSARETLELLATPCTRADYSMRELDQEVIRIATQGLDNLHGGPGRPSMPDTHTPKGELESAWAEFKEECADCFECDEDSVYATFADAFNLGWKARAEKDCHPGVTKASQAETQQVHATGCDYPPGGCVKGCPVRKSRYE
jgi:hypothetical protein